MYIQQLYTIEEERNKNRETHSNKATFSHQTSNNVTTLKYRRRRFVDKNQIFNLQIKAMV